MKDIIEQADLLIPEWRNKSRDELSCHCRYLVVQKLKHLHPKEIARITGINRSVVYYYRDRFAWSNQYDFLLEKITNNFGSIK